jgi:WhiB family redox-sensing transcriptional regulator
VNPADEERAACKKMHPNVFFPEDGDVEAAKAVCYRCPVRKQCLEYAVTNHIQFGYWGGYTAKERRRKFAEPEDVAPATVKNPRQVKDCPSCNRALDRSDFAISTTRGDGLSSECKACMRDRVRRLREARRKAS